MEPLPYQLILFSQQLSPAWFSIRWSLQSAYFDTIRTFFNSCSTILLAGSPGSPTFFQLEADNPDGYPCVSSINQAHNFCKRQKLPKLFTTKIFYSPTMSASNHRTTVYADPAVPGVIDVGPPPTLGGPTVAQLAVSTAGQLNSLAKTVMPDPFRIKRALQLLHRDTSPAVGTKLGFNGAVVKQYYFLVNKEVRVISCPTKATDSSNGAVCLANLGDQPTTTILSASPPKNLEPTSLPSLLKER
jgi:hypothetical protein